MRRGLHKHMWSLFILLGITSQVISQDIHFSQFFETPLLRNPSLAGIFSGDVRLQTVYRTQWNSVTVPYQTVSFNGEYRTKVGRGDDYLTLGGEVLYDKAGTIAMTSTHLQPALNYHKSLSADRNMYLSFGAMGGIVQRKFDRSKMTTNNQFDGSNYNSALPDGETFGKTSYSYFDGSVGMSFNTQLGAEEDNNIFVGLAYHHFNKAPNISFYGNANLEMTPKWVGSIGAKMSMNDYSYFTVQGDYSKQGTFTETIAGALFSWKLDDADDPKYMIHFGAFMRWKDALIPVAKIEFKPLSVAVSYD